MLHPSNMIARVSDSHSAPNHLTETQLHDLLSRIAAQTTALRASDVGRPAAQALLSDLRTVVAHFRGQTTTLAASLKTVTDDLHRKLDGR